MPDLFAKPRRGVPLVDWRAWCAVTRKGHPGLRGGLYYYLLARIAQEKLGRRAES